MKKRSNEFYQPFIEALRKTGDITLRYYFQKLMMQDEYLKMKQRQQLVEEITQNVLARLSVSGDVKKAIQEIDDLKKTINNLVK